MRTYGNLSLRDGRWVLDTREIHIAIRLKQIFPRLAKTGTSPFSFPADDAHALDLDWFTSRYPMAMTPADRRALAAGVRSHGHDVAEAGRILAPDWKPKGTEGLRQGAAIRQYQDQAADLALLMGSLLVGDDVGLGKTFVGIAFALRGVTLPMAAVVLPNMQGQWAEKFAQVCDLECHAVTTTKPYTLPDVPVVLFRYTNIRGWTDVFASGRFRSAMWDEMQELRTGPKTEKGQASMALALNTEYQLGLSATPIYGLGAEVYNVLQFLPGKRNGHVLGSPAEFDREWMGDGKSVREPEALGMLLREQNAFLRRTKGDVGQQMDRVTTMVVDVPYDSKEERRVEDLARTLAIRSLTGSFMERGSAARDLDLLMRHATGVGKAAGVAQFVRMLVETGERVILTGWHRGYHEAILRLLGDLGVAMYTGSETVAGKRRSAADFMSGAARVLLLSNRSGAGIDGLQHVCSTVVIGELDWSPEVHHQIVGRVDRDGQALPVTAYYLVCDGGSDPAMVEMLGLKASQIRGIVDPNRSFPVPRTDEGKVQRLARRWLESRGYEAPQAADADPGTAAPDGMAA